MEVKSETDGQNPTASNNKKGPGGDRRNEWSTLRVTNLPLNTPRQELDNVFADFGPIKKCYVMPGKEGCDTTIGFVTYASPSTAREVSLLTDLESKEHVLELKLLPNTKLTKEKGGRKAGGGDVGPDGVKVKEDNKQRSNPRKARLIIRNLSFKTREEELTKYFARFGALSEVNILKKDNGKMVGCAFLQYKNNNHAVKAIKEANGKPFLGRPVAVDWAVPKEVFKEAVTKEEPKEEPVEEVKDEPEDTDIKMEDQTESKKEIKEETNEDSEDSEGDEKDGDSEDDADDSDENMEEGEEGEEVTFNKPSTGHDIDEKKTVFIKNLSFDSDEEDLRDMMEEVFGPVHFARIVFNKVMNHSKGTAFVKFQNEKDAERCVKISAGEDGLWLDKRQLAVTFAMKKDDVTAVEAERKKKEAKDNRNLYLAREGIIREGTKAAEGVSKQDFMTRKYLLNQKKTMLKNFHNYISATRLVVRNFPPSYDDDQLRKMVLEHAPKKTRLRSVKVMKNMNNIVDGKATSRGYAFVEFNRHEDALAALRNINNNPEIFTADKRPIVDFSIEDKKALNARKKREEKSKMMNPTCKKIEKGKKGDASTLKFSKKKEAVDGGKYTAEFSGASSDPKIKELPKHIGDKRRHKTAISRKDMKVKPLSKRKTLIIQEHKQRLRDQPHQKVSEMRKLKEQNVRKKESKDLKDNRSFDKLVSQYKKKFVSNEKVLKKWFEN